MTEYRVTVDVYYKDGTEQTFQGTGGDTGTNHFRLTKNDDTSYIIPFHNVEYMKIKEEKL